MPTIASRPALGRCMTCHRLSDADPYTREVMCSFCEVRGRPTEAEGERLMADLSGYDLWWIQQAVAQAAD